VVLGEELDGGFLRWHGASLRCQEARWPVAACGGAPGRPAGLQQEEAGAAAPGMAGVLATSSSSLEVVGWLKAGCSGCVGSTVAGSCGQRGLVLDPVIPHESRCLEGGRRCILLSCAGDEWRRPMVARGRVGLAGGLCGVVLEAVVALPSRHCQGWSSGVA
jgi:hypothetical protein